MATPQEAVMTAWPRRNHLSKLRLSIQTAFTLFCIFCGYRFYLFTLWASGRSELFVPRPPAIEAFLPISGLVGCKRLLLTGAYDDIHPAGLTIFIAALLISLLFRKGFCGWICPVGFTSNLVEKLALKLKTLRSPPTWLDLPLLSLKYLLLAFFVFLILFKMDLQAIEAFNRSPYNLVVDAKMLLFFLKPSPMTIGVLVFLVVVSFFSRNAWCRYLCPYGALLGIVTLLSPLRITRKQELCINCHQCAKICPGSIEVATKESINSPQCIGCLECVAACPVEGCLGVASSAQRQLPPLLIPMGILTVFFTLWAWARLSGHWQQQIPMDILKVYYQQLGL